MSENIQNNNCINIEHVKETNETKKYTLKDILPTWIYNIFNQENNTEQNEISYEDFSKKINSFDLLIFYHPDILSKIVLMAETLTTNMNICNHVGMVLKSDIQLDGIDMTRLKILESTVPDNDGPYDVETGKYKSGVQIRDLEDVIIKYQKSGGKVGFCKLKKNPMDVDKEKTIEIFKKIYSEYKTYNYGSVTKLLGSVVPIFRPVRDIVLSVFDIRQVFCSEFATIIYISIGVINEKNNINQILIDPKSVIPTDFIGNDQDGLIPFVEEPIWIKEIKEKSEKINQ